MKSIKKLAIFCFIINIYFVEAQTATSLSNNVDYPISYATGTPEIKVPLFNLQTINENFSLTADLSYNAAAASTVFSEVGFFGKGWEMNIIPSINRQIESGDLFDEEYHGMNTLPYGYTEKPLNDPNVFSYNVFGLSGKFNLIRQGNELVVKKIYTNDYADIHINYTSSIEGNGMNITIDSFQITDKNGFIYLFSVKEMSGLYFSYGHNTLRWSGIYKGLDTFSGYIPYVKNFLLEKVIDNKGTVLVEYIYGSYGAHLTEVSDNFSYDQLYLKDIDIKNIGDIHFNFNTGSKRYLDLSIVNKFQHLISKIAFTNNEIKFYSNNLQSSYSYKMRYNNGVPGTAVLNGFGNYYKEDNCSIKYNLLYNKEDLLYTQGLLRQLIYPTGGYTEFEYEPNTYAVPHSGSLNPLEELTAQNPENYYYEELPVTYDPINKSYDFMYDNAAELYLKFHSQLVTVDGQISGTPSFFYPGLKVWDLQGNLMKGFDFTKQCSYGEKINLSVSNSIVKLRCDPNYPQNISQVKILKKVYKDPSEWNTFLYGPGIRIKKISNYAEEGILANETHYTYTMPDHPKTSSGVICSPVWFTHGGRNTVSRTPVPVLYEYVAIENTGTGKTVYKMNRELFSGTFKEISQVVMIPVSTTTYNANGLRTSREQNEIEIFFESDLPKRQPIMSYITTTADIYAANNKLTTITESNIDPVNRNLINRKITDLQQGEHFEERYSYEKYHKTYRAKEVLKYKNGDLLNRSAFTYTPENGNPQLYQLRKSEVAKDDLPLETEQEITRYDAYGNVLEYRTKEGLYVSQIWGYHDTKIVCELKNIRYQDIDAGIIAGIHYQTNLTDNSYNENYIRTQYQILRQAHPQSMVTSYTYRPMIGMSSLTDTNGRTEYYEYDKFNRLSVVKDHDGNRLKAYEYHYKN